MGMCVTVALFVAYRKQVRLIWPITFWAVPSPSYMRAVVSATAISIAFGSKSFGAVLQADSTLTYIESGYNVRLFPFSLLSLSLLPLLSPLSLLILLLSLSLL